MAQLPNDELGLAARHTCSKCGAELPPDAFKGLCPHCVFKAALRLGKEEKLETIAAPGRPRPNEQGAKLRVPHIPNDRVSDSDNRDPESGLDRARESQSPSTFPQSESLGPGPMARFFGDYELLEEIARGGMGVVYRARQLSLNRTVAVKMILAGQFANQEFIQRFQAEAEAAAGLQHPNIVAIHEVGEHEGQHYFSMDYIAGRNLAQVGLEFGARSWDFSRIARWMMTIAGAIHYAHQRGIIHRDLKPSNVLIDGHDEPRITDFGLAKQIQGDSDITLTGQVLGSPNYLPPEQASGKHEKVDVRSDVYSLGAILFHLLTGRPPFVADTLQATLLQVLQSEPIAPRLLNPPVPADLETICLKCLEKEPINRYPTAEKLAQELGRFLRDEPILARPVTAVEKGWRWCRRNPVVASLSAATLLLLIAVAVGSPIAAFRINRERQQTAVKAEESRRRLVRLNVANATRAVSEGEQLNLTILPWLVEALQLEKGHEDQEQIQLMRLEFILRHCPRKVSSWFHQGGVDNSELRTRTDAQFSPDGQQVLTIGIRPTADGGRESVVTMWNVSNGKAVFPPINRPGVVYHVEFSPSGRHFVTASGVFKDDATVEGEARIWDAATGAPISPPLKRDGVVSHASFSSDGSRVVMATRKRTSQASVEGEGLIWDASSGALLAGPMRHSWEVLMARFSPDDQTVVTAGVEWSSINGEKHYAAAWDSAKGQPLTKPVLLHGPLRDVRFLSNQVHFLAVSPDRQPEARLIDAASGDLLAPPLRHQAGVWDAQFSSDGNRIVTSSSDYSAQVWNAATGRPIIPALKHGHFVRRASFSPDGRRIVTASFDGTVRIWEANSGRALSPPLPHQASVVQAAFSPDGRRILTRTADQVVQIWEFPPPYLPVLSMGSASPVRQAKFSPNGRRILTTGADGATRIWDAQTGARVVPPLAHQGPVTSASFSREGHKVATASEDQTARVWNADTGQPVTPPLQHNGVVWSARFSPDSQRVITASGLPFRGPRRFRALGSNLSQPAGDPEQHFQPGEAVIWNSQTGERLFAFVHSNTVTYAEFSPDGRRIVTASIDKTARLWDAATGRPIGPPLKHSSAVYHASFSPDSQRVVTARGGEPFAVGDAQVWNVTSGQLLLPPLPHAEGVVYAIFSPDGQRVATAGGENAARIWDASDGAALTPYLRHPRQVAHLAFSPDGKLLVTIAGNLARVWDAVTGEPVTPPIAHPEAVFSADFAPDGERIITACRDGRARVWNLRPYHLGKEEMILWTQVLSARQIDRTGTDLEPLSFTALSNAWQKLRAQSSRLISAPLK